MFKPLNHPRLHMLLALCCLWPALLACEGPPKTYDMINPDPLDEFIVNDLNSYPSEAPQWIAIAPFHHVSALEDLIQHRDSQGMNPKIIPVEYIYARYGNGQRHWQAIQAFLNDWRRHYGDRMPRYVVLCGTADPLNRSGMYIPTVRTYNDSLSSHFNAYQPQPAEPTSLISDYPYSLTARDAEPDIAVGRLPARTKQALYEMSTKIAHYESHRRPGAWMREIRVLAGVADNPDKQMLWNHWRSWISPAYRLHYTNFRLDDAFGIQPKLAGFQWDQAMLAGPGMLIYFGPSYQDSLGPFSYDKKHYLILNNRLARESINPAQRTTVISLGHWTARFDGSTPSIAETLLSQPTGPILYIGAARRSTEWGNLRLAAALYQALSEENDQTIGDWFLHARQLLASDQLFPFPNPITLPDETTEDQKRQLDQETLWNYSLLGDPASPLPLATRQFTIQAPATASPGQSITVSYKGTEQVGRIRFSLSTPHDRLLNHDDVYRIIPWRNPEAIDRRHLLANNNVIMESGTLIKDGYTQWIFNIPRDIKPGLYYLSAWGNFVDYQGIAQRPIMILNNKKD